jgi:DNA-binding MarR family transcriptional regulator
MTVLMHLYYQGASEVTHFSDMLQITPAGASQMIERMVQLDMVHRTQTLGDRRVRLVDLTDQGRQVVEQSIAARQAWVEQLVEMLSPEERNLIFQALEQLNHRARELGLKM